MTRDLAQRAGSAVVWRGLSLAGEKLIFLLRLLILARILLPEDFGLAAIALSVGTIATLFSAAGLKAMAKAAP